MRSPSSSGPLVTTSGQVIKGAGSPGQQVCTGRAARSTSAPSITTSWQGAEPTVRGFMAITVLSRGSISKASRQPPGGSGWRRKARVSPIWRSSSGSRSMPQATRSTVPNRLTRTGISEGWPSARRGFSNSTAGPPSANSRVWISVISSTVETGSETRTSRPSTSRRAMKSRSEL